MARSTDDTGQTSGIIEWRWRYNLGKCHLGLHSTFTENIATGNLKPNVAMGTHSLSMLHHLLNIVFPFSPATEKLANSVFRRV